MDSLVGQSALIEHLMNIAAVKYMGTEWLDDKSKRLAHYLLLQKIHLKVLDSISSLHSQA